MESMFFYQYNDYHPRSTKIQKWFFWDFGQKMYFSPQKKSKKYSKVESGYIDESHKKIQSLLVNFDGISAISRKGHPKSEKNKRKMEQFSSAFSKWIFNKLDFSYRGNISYINGKIQLLQKRIRKYTWKLFLFDFPKNWNNGILLNFEIKYLIEVKWYRL